MTDYYAIPRYSKREVVNAGKALKGTITAADDTALEVFRIAHNWRDAHLAPMHQVRRELRKITQGMQTNVVTAARLKRMKSIRRKLENTPLSLYQIQDIGGCRVIFDSMPQIETLLSIYRAGKSNHGHGREWDYITNPKSDGYRSHHIVFKFNGRGRSSVYNRQRIEVQLRTRLQHAWATAVEAVGLARNENLKAGEGDKNWLRFFEIVSGEFSIAENCPMVPGVSEDNGVRRTELRELEKQLGAIKKLESYNRIINFAETFSSFPSTRYYLIQYDHANEQVIVQPYSTYATSSANYINEERAHDSRDTVLVEVDKVDDLKSAFPNYFLDVKMFVDRLKLIYRTGNVEPVTPDYSWVRRVDWRKKSARPSDS